MKTKIIKLVYAVLCCLFMAPWAVNAQIADERNRLGITLSDGTQVVLLGESISLSNAKSKNYRYLPFSLRLAEKSDGSPEFLFLKYITEEKEINGGVGGALLHMLMYWGPTPAQRTELEEILKNGEQGARRGSKLKGALEVKPDGEKSMKIISATLSDDKLARSVIQSFSAPVLEGGRAAMASSLSPEGAQLLAATFEKKMAITDLSVELGYTYTVRVPAAKGRVTVRWEEIRKHYEQDSASYKETSSHKSRGGVFGFIGDALFGKKETVDKVSYDEVRSVIDEMYDKEYIKIDWEENMADERIEKVRETFFDFFLQKMTQSAESAELAPPTEKEKEAMPDIKKGYERYDLNLKLAVEKPFTVTGNLASWYDGAKHNEKCVADIILNDQFFQHRDINFILDSEAKDLLEMGEANYATVNIRKKRSSGNDFNDAITLDYDYLKNSGLKASITYARGNDTNSDLYEYKTQWSTRGGNIYPENPKWIKGDWQGVTLEPPVIPQTIEFEADIEELESLGIPRATLQLRYSKFGKEIETNIPITVSKGESLIEKTIFTDREIQGYAYRIILTHKDKGKMVLPWDAKVNDNYVYASIPQELKDEDPDYLDKIIKAGEVILKPNSDGEVSDAAKVLDKFKSVIKVVTSD